MIPPDGARPHSGHPPGGRGESRHRRDGHRVRGGPRRKFLAGEWPDDPSFRFLVHWALRREELCDPGLCPDAPEEGGQRCDHCPLDRLDAAQCAEKGLLIRRALDLMGALKLGVHIGLGEIRAEEFCAMLIIAEERDLLERERAGGARR